MEENEITLSEKEKMLKGLIFNKFDSELIKENDLANKKCFEFNQTKPEEKEKRELILKSLIKIEENCKYLITKHFYCEYGYNISIKNNFFSLFNLTLLDQNPITFGNNIFIGPNCTFYTLIYPIEKINLRNNGFQYAKPIKIGNNVFFGSNISVLPGINIGNNVIILDGSIISKNIPDNSFVYGNPCRINFLGENFNNENNILEIIKLIQNENLNLCDEYNLNNNEEERKKFIKENFKLALNEEFCIMERLNVLKGKNITIGENYYSNYNSVIIDISEIKIGNSTLIGPNLTITTMNFDEKYKLINLPVNIGNNVWIGGNVIIIGGISIGNNCVIGAGSLVNINIPDNCVVVGNPCKILRKFEIKKLNLNFDNNFKSEKEKMLNEEIHYSNDNELVNEREKSFLICHKFNYSNKENKKILFEGFFKNKKNPKNKGINIKSFFNCDYGYNINFKDKFDSNINLILLDICEINFGNNCIIGPNCSFYCPYHPIEDIEGRDDDLEYGKKIFIGNNVLICGNCTFLPGVKIGNNCVIGYGSIVNKNIPDNSFAFGNPCKVKNIIV